MDEREKELILAYAYEEINEEDIDAARKLIENSDEAKAYYEKAVALRENTPDSLLDGRPKLTLDTDKKQLTPMKTRRIASFLATVAVLGIAVVLIKTNVPKTATPEEVSNKNGENPFALSTLQKSSEENTASDDECETEEKRAVKTFAVSQVRNAVCNDFAINYYDYIDNFKNENLLSEKSGVILVDESDKDLVLDRLEDYEAVDRESYLEIEGDIYEEVLSLVSNDFTVLVSESAEVANVTYIIFFN